MNKNKMQRKFLYPVLNAAGLTLHSCLRGANDRLAKTTSTLKKSRKQLEEARYDLTKLQMSIDDRLVKKFYNKEKASQAKLSNWSKKIREVGECDICTSPNQLTAHHLWDKHTHPTLAFQQENGVCLCKTCHEGFHEMYTYKSHCSPSLYQKYKVICLNKMNQ